jgi:hypothetical protein
VYNYLLFNYFKKEKRAKWDMQQARSNPGLASFFVQDKSHAVITSDAVDANLSAPTLGV